MLGSGAGFPMPQLLTAEVNSQPSLLALRLEGGSR